MDYCIHLLFDKSKVLLLRRSPDNPYYPNIWTPIIGKIKYNEDPLAAVKRETYEETGIEVNSISFLSKIIKKEHTYWVYFSRHNFKDLQVKLNHENNKYTFYEAQRLPESLWLLFREQIQVLINDFAHESRQID